MGIYSTAEQPYLGVVVEVGFHDILNVGRIHSYHSHETKANMKSMSMTLVQKLGYEIVVSVPIGVPLRQQSHHRPLQGCELMPLQPSVPPQVATETNQ